MIRRSAMYVVASVLAVICGLGDLLPLGLESTATAYAQGTPRQSPSGKVIVLPWAKEGIGSLSVVVRDPKTGREVAQPAPRGNFVFSIERPAGEYLVELEGVGVRRSSFNVRIEGSQTREVAVELTNSDAPVTLQRLVPFWPVQPRTIRTLDFLKPQGTRFEPIGLFESGAGAVVSVTRSGHVFRVARGSHAAEEMGRLNLRGHAMGHCLVAWQGKEWIASISHAGSLHGRESSSYLTLSSIDLGRGRLRTQTLEHAFTHPGRFQGISFDVGRERLLLADRLSGGVFVQSVPGLVIDGELDLKPLRSEGLNSPALALARHDGSMFVSEPGSRSLLQFDADGGAAATLAGGLGDLSGMALSPAGDKVLVTDRSGERVVEVDVSSGERRLVADKSHGLNGPVAVLQTTSGETWVAEAGLLVRIR